MYIYIYVVNITEFSRNTLGYVNIKCSHVDSVSPHISTEHFQRFVHTGFAITLAWLDFIEDAFFHLFAFYAYFHNVTFMKVVLTKRDLTLPYIFPVFLRCHSTNLDFKSLIFSNILSTTTKKIQEKYNSMVFFLSMFENSPFVLFWFQEEKCRQF